MFDIGFSELLMVGLVALIVIGPERLPTAARTIGLLLGRVKRGINSVREEVEREIGADQIKLQLRNEEILARERKLLEDTLKQATSVGADFEQKLRETTSILNSPAVSDTEQKNGVDSKLEPASIEQDKQQQ